MFEYHQDQTREYRGRCMLLLVQKPPLSASVDFKIRLHLYLPGFISLRYSWCLQIQEMPNICFI